MNTINKIESWYNTKETFTTKENNYINSLIDSYEIETDEINQFIKNYIYNKLESLSTKYDNQTIWSFTDEHINNALTSKENYKELLNFIKE